MVLGFFVGCVFFYADAHIVVEFGYVFCEEGVFGLGEVHLELVGLGGAFVVIELGGTFFGVFRVVGRLIGGFIFLVFNHLFSRWFLFFL